MLSKRRTWSLPRLASLASVVVFAAATAIAAENPQLVVLADIGGDPDDQQSMIRLMVYANKFDVELLIATAVRKKHAKEGPTTRPHLIRQIVDA